MHFSYICTLSFHLFCWVVIVSLFLADSLHMAPKRKSAPSRNPLHFRASSSDPTPLHVRFHDEKAYKDFSENFSRRGVHSKSHMVLWDFSNTTLLTVIRSRGWESLCEIPMSCPTMIIQEFYSNMHRFDTSIPQFAMQIQGTRLRIVPKDELLSLFCETPSSWSERQNTSCSGFAKDPRFLNMVMTFVFHPLSYYNSIIEPHSCFLLSLIKDHSIDFPFHFILSLIDVYKDMMTSNKLIFPSTITRIIRYSFIPYPESSHFIVISAISVASVR